MEEVEVTVSDLKKSAEKRPCLYWVDIILKKENFLQYLSFKNYYTASITITFKRKQSNSYEKLVEDYELVENPHFEDDSQDYKVINLQDDTFQHDLSKIKVEKLRIYYFQPSPNWKRFGLRKIRFFNRNPKLALTLNQKRTKKEEKKKEKKNQNTKEEGITFLKGKEFEFYSPKKENYKSFVEVKDESKPFSSNYKNFGAILFEEISLIKEYNGDLVEQQNQHDAQTLLSEQEEIITLSN